MPKRVQMTRKKGGWRKDHPDAVIVARPSKWGNPFLMDRYAPPADMQRRAATDAFARWICEGFPAPEGEVPPDVSELRGKDLACWCPLDQPCHADVLLKLAND